MSASEFADKCTWCMDWWKGMMDNVDETVSFPQFKAQLAEYSKKLWQHQNEVHGTNHKLGNTKQGNGKHCGEWAFTLTMAPDDGLTEDDMTTAVMKIMSQQSCPVKKYAWYLEHKEDERHPHIHGIYETESGGRIEAKHFKRAWTVWNEKKKLGAGFRGGYHRPVITTDEYLGYISKDKQTAKKFDYKGYMIIG